MKAVGEAATHLAWLCPSAASLVVLARSPTATVWEEVRDDPGAVLLLLRQAPEQAASPPSFLPASVHEPVVLLEAARLLEAQGPGYVDWSRPAVQPIYHACRTFARLAFRLAERSGRGDPDNAWAAGLLAPLGWLAVSAIDPEQSAACLADPELPAGPVPIQQKYWGFDHAGIARRLARRWHLPRWLVAVAGHLDLRVETAQILGADPDLFRLAQLAVALVQRQGITLHLPVGGYPEELATGLGLPVSELIKIEQEVIGEPGCVSARSPEIGDQKDQSVEWNSFRSLTGPNGMNSVLRTEPFVNPQSSQFCGPPAHLPLLRDLLRIAAENRQLGDAPVIEGLERDVDQLHRAFQEQRNADEQRLHVRKLESLAEFAAGAGHEINNPLAVISGQAQYLIHHEGDAAKQKALQTIVGQTQRINQILNEMMQFARLLPSIAQPVDVPTLMAEVTASLSDLAGLRRVRLICPQPAAVQLHADPQQLKTVLGSLLRNAIEAAPTDGWAGLRLEASDTGGIDLIVEDNGSGPQARDREHMFDPFYSGREAGRGRGLGLSIAWRLARQLGGDVRFDEIPGGPTRFVLTLPHDASSAAASIMASASNDLPAAA
jgi:signal transduction histidine kinase